MNSEGVRLVAYWVIMSKQDKTKRDRTRKKDKARAQTDKMQTMLCTVKQGKICLVHGQQRTTISQSMKYDLGFTKSRDYSSLVWSKIKIVFSFFVTSVYSH